MVVVARDAVVVVVVVALSVGAFSFLARASLEDWTEEEAPKREQPAKKNKETGRHTALLPLFLAPLARTSSISEHLKKVLPV